MSQVTKEDLAEINQELTETIRRLDRENEELMEQEKAATVDTIEQERRKLKRELRRGREKIEDAREAMSEAIADQKTMGFFRIVMAGLLSWTAVMGALWVEEATISPEWGVSLGGVLIVMLILMRWGLKEAMKEEAET